MADIIVNAGGNLQSAIDSAAGGDRVLLEAGATFEGNFTLPVHGDSSYATIQTNGTIPGDTTRVTPSLAANFAKIIAPSGGLPAIATLEGAQFWKLVGLESLFNPGGFNEVYSFGNGDRTQQTILSQCPRFIIVDRCYIHNSTGKETQKRAIGINGRDTEIKNCYIVGVKSSGQDSQAIAGFNGPGPFTIYNNYLDAASENILFGGADCASLALMPSNIRIINNYITKVLPINSSGYNVKCLLELKVGINVTINGNILENCWADAQPQGMAVQFTVRNQDGFATWSEIRNVSFTNNIVRNVGGGINFGGADVRDDGTVVPTNGLTGMTLRDNVFYNVTSAQGTGRFLQFNNGGNNYVVDHNTCINSQGGGSVAVYFADGSVNGFIFTNNIYKDNGLGVFGTNGEPLGTATLEDQAPGYTFRKNVMIGCPFASMYPDDNFSPATIEDVSFVNPSLNNYELSNQSIYNNAGTDSTDIGARFSTVVPDPPPPTPPSNPPPPDPNPPPNPDPGDPEIPGSFGGSCGLYLLEENRRNDQIYLDYTQNTKVLKKRPDTEATIFLVGDE